MTKSYFLEMWRKHEQDLEDAELLFRVVHGQCSDDPLAFSKQSLSVQSGWLALATYLRDAQKIESCQICGHGSPRDGMFDGICAQCWHHRWKGVRVVLDAMESHLPEVCDETTKIEAEELEHHHVHDR